MNHVPEKIANALVELFDLMQEEWAMDENFKCCGDDPKTDRLRKVNNLITMIASVCVTIFGIPNLSYLHIWLTESGQIMLCMPRSAENREWAIAILENALRLARIVPISQQEARNVRG